MYLEHQGVWMCGVEATLGTWLADCISPKMCMKGVGLVMGARGLQRREGAEDLSLLGRLATRRWGCCCR